MILPRKVLTPEQMRKVDAATVEAGIPGIILMENAAHRALEYLEECFGPLHRHRIAVICGKGNNGGDGLALARLLHVLHQPLSLRTALIAPPSGDAALALAMFHAAGLSHTDSVEEALAGATLIVDAILGTGLRGPAEGAALAAIEAVNRAEAKVFSIDIPSGLSGSSGNIPGALIRADATVTFTAPKVCHVIAPACDNMGALRISPIGSPEALYDDALLGLVTPECIATLFAPRQKESNKGRYGHVLVVAGARGKSGAAAMAGMAALRAGAGLVTVACPASALDAIAAFAPELMTEPLPETPDGVLSDAAFARIEELAFIRSLIAIGPGLGTGDGARKTVAQLFASVRKPMVLDADALNCLAMSEWPGKVRYPRILTPHPGEMSRLTGLSVAEIQADRLNTAQEFARKRNVTLVLKGHRTLTAFPDGRLWVNPSGSPAMSTAGTGDILTGLTAGLLAQFPEQTDLAVAAAVYWHGLAGELAANKLSEQTVIATDLLHSLSEASRVITNVSYRG